jgi:hypothetical protein
MPAPEGRLYGAGKLSKDVDPAHEKDFAELHRSATYSHQTCDATQLSETWSLVSCHGSCDGTAPRFYWGRLFLGNQRAESYDDSGRAEASWRSSLVGASRLPKNAALLLRLSTRLPSNCVPM